MKRSIQPGTCELCGQRESSAKMTRHLEACAVSHGGKGPSQELITLEFAARADPRYWIQLEVRASAKLKALDSFLRELWLECCGHLSSFAIGRDELGMNSTVGNVLGTKGQTLRYQYDFGSTTELEGRVLGTRRGSLGRAVVRILARNDALVWTCAQCENPAAIVCPFCAWDGTGVLCSGHAKEHEHAGEDAYLPVVNSPRMGVCGYTGPG